MAFGWFKKKNKEASLSNDKYIELVVSDVIHETKEAVTIAFNHPEGNKISYKSGQFLTFILTIDGEEVRRSYSLCTSPFVDDQLAVTVKRVTGGKMSNYLNDNIKVGDKVKLMAPMGNFTTEYNETDKRHFIMFGGGSGITPLMSIIKSLLHKEPESKVTLIYANKNEDSIIFGEKIVRMDEEYMHRFNIAHVLEDAQDGNYKLAQEGLVTPELINKVMSKIPVNEIDDIEIYLCGPQGMMDIVLSTLSDMSIPSEKINKESFISTSEKNKEDKKNGQTIDVTIKYDGETHTFPVKPDRSILDTALDQGIDLPHSCQSGLCTACMGRLVSGEIHMDEDDGLSDEQKEEGCVLICVGHPKSENVVIEVD